MLALAVVLVAPGVHGQADDAKAEAKARVAGGARLYDAGDYEGALADFRAAYAQYPNPKLLFNVGLAYRRLARDADALGAFAQFIAEATDAEPGLRDEARGYVRELRERVATIEVSCDVDGADVAVDGHPYGITPLAGPIIVTAGAHRVVVRKAGLPAPHVEAVEPGRGGALTVKAALLPLNVPRTAPDATPAVFFGPPAAALAAPAPISNPTTGHEGAPRSVTARWWFWAAVAAAAAAGIVGGVIATRPTGDPAVPPSDFGYHPVSLR